MTNIQILRGDVVKVRLNPTEGSETRGTARPCVVVQNDVGNQNSPNTIVIPVTDARGRRAYPFQVFIEADDGGLTKDSIALGEQIRVIDKKRIIEKMGTLREKTIEEMDIALCNSLDL